MHYDAIVIGGGQAGLAAGYYMHQAGLRFRILEAGAAPGGSWPLYRDNLVLNSPARYDALPGMAFPAPPDHYPTRDEVTAYLRSYAVHHRLPLHPNAPVQRVERLDDGFQVTTTSGKRYTARTIVAASGFFGEPSLPTLPGMATYRGQMLHVAAYRRPEPFRDQRVVVVGGGNSAVEVGVELAQVAHVSLSARRPIRWLPQRLLGHDIHYWLHTFGFDELHWAGARSIPVYATPAYRAALRRGQPDRRPLLHALTPEGVLWSDGTTEPVDVVIFATGYRPQLRYLAGLGAWDATGRVLQQNGCSTSVAGLFYVGLIKQRTSASTTIRGAVADARLVVRQIQRVVSRQSPLAPLAHALHQHVHPMPPAATALQADRAAPPG